MTTPRTLFDAFNHAINRRDLEALVRLMTPAHRFVDAAGGTVEGRAAAEGAWRGFFGAFPDYLNHIETVIERDGEAIATGHSTCAEAALAGPAIWRAAIEGDRVAVWQVYEDTPEIRRGLGLG